MVTSYINTIAKFKFKQFEWAQGPGYEVVVVGTVLRQWVVEAHIGNWKYGGSDKSCKSLGVHTRIEGYWATFLQPVCRLSVALEN